MQFFKTADLKPGMRLAKPIYNRMGVLLYERDTKLTMQGINSIENFGLIGIFILEPAEPLPPLTKEDLEFEQFQTIYMFRLRENIKKLQEHTAPDTLHELAENIIMRYGALDHKLNFTQNLRSSADFVYKHAISVAILVSMISHQLGLIHTEQINLVYAALLYDLGYLTVPYSVLDKGNDLTEEDKDAIQINLENGYQTLHPEYNDYKLPTDALELVHQYIFSDSKRYHLTEDSVPDNIEKLLPILRIAVDFDQMTAMNLNQTPVSEVVAMRRLSGKKELYPDYIVHALAESIHILPTGCCVDLANGEKALVLEDNPDDFTRPLVLRFNNNNIVDLSDPQVFDEFQIVDTMKTMDNRIHIDEETLKHFSADESIMAATKRIKQKKLDKAAQRVQRVMGGKKKA